MNKEQATKPNALVQMASKFNLGSATFMNTLKATVMKPGKDGKVPSNEEIAAFLLVANKYDLNPFTNEIYAFPGKKGEIVPVVGIDGFITLANRHPEFDGYTITWAEDEFEMMDKNDKAESKKCPAWCEITVHRKDREHAMVVREYLDEVYRPAFEGKGKSGTYKIAGPWQSHTKRMLRHKTMIQGFRVAFGLTGVYDEDEAHRIVEAQVVEDSELSKPETQKPQAAVEDHSQDQQQAPQEEQQPPQEEATGDQRVISEAQVKRLFAIAGENGYEEEDIKTQISYDHNYDHIKDIKRCHYEEIVNRFSIQKGA